MSGLHRPARQTGFTLLEVMIALAVTVIALSALLSGGATALRAGRSVMRHEQAMSLARSTLALVTANLAPGERSDTTGDGFQWHSVTRPLSSARITLPGEPRGVFSEAPAVTLYDVTVRITWHDGAGGGSDLVETRRLGPAATVN